MWMGVDTGRTSRNTVRMGNIRVEIPDELHRAFKALAANQGKTVKALLIEVMSETVQKDKEKK